MDDLFALVEEEDDNDQQLFLRDDVSLSSKPQRQDIANSSLRQPPTAPKSIQERLSSSIDGQIGVRIVNRKISGAELMDKIAASCYRSPAVLCSMSLEDLNNQILAEPTMVVDGSTVCGRTNFCTAGIVFSNSGTRMSSTGNAFCVLTVGNLASGPAISVLLFGTAYSKYIRTLTPGKVVLLENPRLVPNNKNNQHKDTSISFSTNNDREIQLIGDAQDYGICKGMVRGKNEHGQWMDNMKRCKAYVDTRQCLYCKVHRQQTNVSQNTPSGNNHNKLQKLRQESKDCPSQTQFPMMNRVNGVSKINPDLQRPTNPTQVMMKLAAQPMVGSTLRPSYHSSSEIHSRQQTKNPLLQNCTIQGTSRNAVGPVPTSRNVSLIVPKVTPVPKMVPPRRSLIIQNKQPTNPDLFSQLTGSRPNPNKRKHVSVNTDIGHFDGQVPIPKAKQFIPIHRDKAAMVQARQSRPSLDVGTRSQADILLRQRQLAEQRTVGVTKHQPLQPTTQNLLDTTNKKKNKATSLPTKGNDIFGSIGKEEMARVMAAKSRFADEADAEEYARARQAVIELEKEELKTLRQEEKKKKKQSVSSNQTQSSIKTEYFCVQCNRNFVKVPPACQLLHHKIRVERKILATQTTAEKRMILSKKSVEDGGMVLAQGIDWSDRFSSRT